MTAVHLEDKASQLMPRKDRHYLGNRRTNYIVNSGALNAAVPCSRSTDTLGFE